jgi:serine/threonine-protein kinase
MGTVWLARMTGKLGFERLVALKTILPTYSQDRQFCDMFLDEAKIAAQIDHENVARILEIGEDRGVLYYAMELIDGESLRKLYRDIRAAKTPFPMGIALRIVADACAGLHATHELQDEAGQALGVVHRDVSPQNLLVSVRGTTKLIDFGVAKANARRSEETAAGTLKGKIEYMAPEQGRGEPLDRRADVYALGAVLYELLAGRPVRDTDEGKQFAALHELMTGAPYVPLPDTVPHLVRVLVDRALARDPAKRYASAEDFRRALEQVMLATGQGATTDEVGNVLAHYSRERTAKRKDAIERALRAATDGRVNATTLVAPLSQRANGPFGAPGVGGGPGGTAPGTPISHAAMRGPLVASGPMPIAPASFHSSPPSGVIDGPPTGPSMHTIGAASMSAHPMPPPASSGTSAAKIFAGVLVLALVAVLGVVAGVFVTRRGQHADRTLASSASAPTIVLTGQPVPAVDPGPVSAVNDPFAAPTGVAIGASDPSAASAHAASGNAKDAGTAGAAVSGRRPGAGSRGPGKAGAGKQGGGGDGDEYGF